MSERLLVTDARGIAPWAASLRALERSITYPLADGAERFFIDHGADYHPFFSALGDPRFLLALDGARVVGSIAGVFRTARVGDQALPSVYLCDLKVEASRRGTGLARRMAGLALWRAATDPSLWRWRIAYGAAMRGARGDVTRSVRGMHPGRLLSPEAVLALYFVPAGTLAALDVSGCPGAPGGAGLDLSPGQRDDIVRTAGRKDLRLVSTDAPWPLAHLPRGPREWSPSLGAYLRACGARVADEDHPAALTCFALDRRLARHVAWLAERGVSADTACTVYTLRLGVRRAPWTHLATSEI